MQKLGRNDPCHCGSGKKYKNCHQQTDGANPGGGKSKTIGIITALLIIAALVVFVLNSQKPDRGEAPPGKVWSEEHQHYH